MYRKGHIGISLLFGSVLFVALPVEVSLPLVAVLGGSERLPDQDFNVPFLSHREFSHTILGGVTLATLIVGGLWAWLTYTDTAILSKLPIGDYLQQTPQLAAIIWVGVVLGFIAHLCGDMITPEGVKPLWPVSDWKPSFELCRADNTRWNRRLLVVGQVSAIGAIALQTNAVSVPM